MINIQFQDQVGNWITVSVTDNISINILRAMQEVQRNFGGRVRAVDQNGRLVDILM